MELLDNLIRTLTYKRSCLELALKEGKENGFENDPFIKELEGKINGYNACISEIYKLVNEIDK